MVFFGSTSMKNPMLNFCSYTIQLKKVHWKASCRVLIAKPALDTLIGLASNVVAEAGSPQHFSFIKAESTSLLSNTFLGQRFPNSKQGMPIISLFSYAIMQILGTILWPAAIRERNCTQVWKFCFIYIPFHLQ